MTKKMQSVCKAYGKKPRRAQVSAQAVKKQEPGRMMAGRYIPNRIFRGKIIEVLRDSKKALRLPELGKAAIADWSMDQQAEWLDMILQKLIKDGLLEMKGNKYRLKAWNKHGPEQGGRLPSTYNIFGLIDSFHFHAFILRSQKFI